MTWQSPAVYAAVSPQAVWDVLLDGRRWSFWNPGIEWMWLEGDPQPGTLVTIKMRRVRQTALAIDEVVVPATFRLRLTIGPIARLQVGWSLTRQDAGTSIVAHLATRGIAARIFDRSAARVAAAMPAFLERLAERAAGAN